MKIRPTILELFLAKQKDGREDIYSDTSANEDNSFRNHIR